MLNGDPGPADDRLANHDLGIKHDPGEKFIVGHLYRSYLTRSHAPPLYATAGLGLVKEPSNGPTASRCATPSPGIARPPPPWRPRPSKTQHPARAAEPSRRTHLPYGQG